LSKPLKAQVSGFHFINGVSQEGAPHSLVSQKGDSIPPTSKSTKGNFYVLVEIMGNPPGADQLADKLTDIIQKTYATTHGTTTTALRTALRAANQFLLNENLKSAYEAQRDGSVCCLVLRGQDAYIARSGPTAAYHIRGNLWTRFPSKDPGEAQAGALVPLGLRKEPDIAFHHIELEAGDLLMLVESRGDQALSPARFDGPPDAAATSALRQAGQQQDFSTLMIEIGDKGLSTPAAHPSKEKAPREKTRKPTARKRRAPRDAPDAVAAAPPRPDRSEETIEEEGGRRRQPRFSRIAIILALITPLLVAGGFLGYNWYQQQQTEKALTGALASAKENYTTARTTSDNAVAQAALAQAQNDLAKAVEIAPEDERIPQLARDLKALDEEFRLITPLYFVPELYRFVGANSEPGRIVVNGNDVYILDRRNSAITRHVMNEVADGLERGKEMTKVVAKGQQVGSIVVGNLVDMTWAPAGGERTQDNLLVLDASGNLIAYNEATGLSASILPGSEDMDSPLLIDSFSGARLYVLDAGAHQIYRYTPTEDGYTLPPDPYFGDDVQVNLSGVRDMSIDGDIWLLFLDHIDRYQAGRPVAYVMQGLDQSFSDPAGLFATLAEASSELAGVYIADTGNARIVKLTKDGLFLRQYRPREGNQFSELRDLYIDVDNSKAYILSGSALYMADIPLGE